MSFSRMHKWVAYLMAGLGLIALTLGPFLDTSSELVIFVAYVASFFVDGPRIRDPRWARAWTVGLFVLIAIQIIRGVSGASILPLVLEFTAALQLSRLYNRRGAREYQQIGALALLHLIAATVLSTELLYGIAFIGFVVAAPWILALGHLRAEVEAQQEKRPEEEREGAIAKILASKRLVGPRYLMRTAALAIPLFAMTGILFIAFPRVGFGFLSFGRGVGQRVSGFGGNVELGDFGVIRSDPTVVLRVVPPGLGDNPPQARAIRMRGTSFDQYDGRRWTRSRELYSSGVGRVGSYYAIPFRNPDPERDESWSVILDSLEEPVIFLPPDTVGLEIPPRVVAGLDLGREISIAPGMDIRYGDGDGLGLRYSAWTSLIGRERQTETLPFELRERYLTMPEGHERVAALAQRWASGATTDEARAHALIIHLRDSEDFVYSLEMPHVGDRVPLEVFLFEARSGHCEYYSTALAVMLRSLGIPSRNVTGFVGGRYNEYGSYYEISQGDAHSWVEAYFEGRGWVALDATPPARDAIGPDPGWFGGARQMLDALKTRWAESVVGYDLRSQVSLFRDMRGWLRTPSLSPPARGPPLEEDAVSVSLRRIPRGVWLLAAFLLVGILAFAYRSRGWRRAGAPVEDPSMLAAIELYRQLDAVLAKLGHARPDGCAPLERIDRLEAAGFRELGLARQVTEQYLNARFGGRQTSPEAIATLRQSVRSLRDRRDLFGVGQ